MDLTSADILDAIFDSLVTGELVADVPAFRVTRTGPEILHLDYGDAGRFVLTVAEEG